MAFSMPLVVAKSRTVDLGAGQSGTRERLTAVINAQSLADLHAILVGVATDETAAQERLGNPPTMVIVDNRPNKPLDQARGKIVVHYGVVLTAAAMRVIENTLRQAIASSTRVRSGKLLNISGSWEWRYIPRGGVARTVSAANPPTSFRRGDMLTLMPKNVPYATAVNRAVARSGRLNQFNFTAKGATGRRRKAEQAKSTQNIGFLGTAARALRRNQALREFSVTVDFTRRFAVPGEVYSHGSGVITIRPRLRTAKR